MNALLIHGWAGSPDSDFFPWLRKELSKKFAVECPLMPDTDSPKINPWLREFSKHVKDPEDTVVIGHSIGCQTMLRYLEKYKGKPFKAVIFVAGWITLKGLDAEEKPIAKPWLEKKIDLGKVKGKAENLVAIFSDNDPFVSLSNAKYFRKIVSKIVIVKKQGHFSAQEGVHQVPAVIKELKILKLL